MFEKLSLPMLVGTLFISAFPTDGECKLWFTRGDHCMYTFQGQMDAMMKCSQVPYHLCVKTVHQAMQETRRHRIDQNFTCQKALEI